MLMNVKMPTFAGILTYMSMINFIVNELSPNNVSLTTKADQSYAGSAFVWLVLELLLSCHGL